MSDQPIPPTPPQSAPTQPELHTRANPKSEFGSALWLFPLALIGALCLCLTLLVSLGGLGWALTGSHPVVISTLAQIFPTRPSTAGLQVPTATPAPPTSLPVEATATAQAAWPVVYQDGFDQNTNNWQTVSSNTSTGKVSIDVANGKYRWEVRDLTQEFYVPTGPDFAPLDDFDASVEIDQLQGSPLAITGLIFRANQAGFYSFTLNQQGEYRFFVEYNSQLINSKIWTEPKVPLKSGVNKLGVSASGSHFIFFLNDEIVGEVDDTHFGNGWVGIDMGAPVDKAPLTVEFDNFTVRAPSLSGAEAPAATAAANLLATQTALPVFLDDTFSASSTQWPTRPINNDYFSIQLSIVNNKYHLQAKALQGFFWSQTPNSLAPDNMYYSADIQKINGPGDADSGLTFRQHGNGDLYYFSVDDDRKVYVGIRLADQWTMLLSQPNTLAFHPGQVNRLAVVTQGAHFTFYVNDQYVGEVEDTHLSFGEAGFGIDVIHAGDTAEYEFSNYQLRNLKASGTASAPVAGHTPLPSATLPAP